MRSNVEAGLLSPKEAEPAFEGVGIKFPGQGSQHAGMAKELAKFRIGREIFDEASEIVRFDLLSVCINGSDSDLRDTQVAQPAMLAADIAWFKIANQLNPDLKTSYYLGHSLGEYAAFVAAGALPFADAVKLVKERSTIMKKGCMENPGGMMVVSGGEINVERFQEICLQITAGKDKLVQVANINSPVQVVLSGTHEGLKEASLAIEGLNDFRITPLESVAGAYHSTLMDPENELAEHVLAANFKDTIVPVILNTTGKPTTSGEEMKEWAKVQHISALRWSDSVRFALNSGVKIFVQYGPGDVLTNLLKRIDKSAKGIRVNDVKSLSNFLNSRN